MTAKKNPFQLEKGLALDIDDTISNTSHRLVRHLQVLFGNPENLTAKEIIKKYHLSDYIPYWQTDEVMQYHQKMSYNDDVHKDFPVIENAVSFVNKINKTANISCYLTLRRQNVINGTARWLKKHGFPDKPIICRPDNMEYDDGHAWKAKVLIENPNIIGLIDDNEKIINYLPKNYRGTIFLIRRKEYNHHNKIKIIPCRNWFVVLKEVKKILPPKKG